MTNQFTLPDRCYFKRLCPSSSPPSIWRAVYLPRSHLLEVATLYSRAAVCELTERLSLESHPNQSSLSLGCSCEALERDQRLRALPPALLISPEPLRPPQLPPSHFHFLTYAHFWNFSRAICHLYALLVLKRLPHEQTAWTATRQQSAPSASLIIPE